MRPSGILVLPDSSVREILADSRGITLEGRGDYRRASWMKQAGFEQIGSGRTFETMVFKAGERCTAEGCNCGMPELADASELDADGYNDPALPNHSHSSRGTALNSDFFTPASVAAKARPATKAGLLFTPCTRVCSG